MARPNMGHSDEYELDPFADSRSLATMDEKLAPPALPASHSTASGLASYGSERDLLAAGRAPQAELHYDAPRRSGKKKWIIGGIIGALLVIGVAVGVGIGVTQANKNKGGSDKAAGGSSGSGSSGGSGTGSGTGSGSTTAPDAAASGSSGSNIAMENGQSFTYSNEFGGSWAVDPAKPFETSGQANSWTPKITEQWTWGKDVIHGVNLGGWLVTEPFICPALYEQYVKMSGTQVTADNKVVDEYTLSQAMGADLATKMEEHYKTFITEQDFAEIAGAGLNWVRIPIGFWAFGVVEGEPYLPNVSWTYFTKAISWARKYGIRILMDFHALPGSQNGWNHSGRYGSLNWMTGPMGIANAERSLENIRSMVEYISQPGIREVVPMIGLVNEVRAMGDAGGPATGKPALEAFYLRAYQTIRGVTGYGAGNGPVIAFHEAMMGLHNWDNHFLPGADRLAVDWHPYIAFNMQDPDAWNGQWDAAWWSKQANFACSWGNEINRTQTQYGIAVGGEFSAAVMDCGMWLNGVGNTAPGFTTVKKGSCEQFDDWTKWDQTMKDSVKNVALASMNALHNYFYWTWKIGNSTTLGRSSSPMWHYRLGRQEGWIPKDPREAAGWCRRNNQCPGGTCNDFSGSFLATATGGEASPTIAADVLAALPWPPVALNVSASNAVMTTIAVAGLPTLTQTGTPTTLAPPAELTKFLTAKGWANPSDTAGAFVPVSGCAYDPYNTASLSAANVGSLCKAAAKRRLPAPTPTA